MANANQKDKKNFKIELPEECNEAVAQLQTDTDKGLDLLKDIGTNLLIITAFLEEKGLIDNNLEIFKSIVGAREALKALKEVIKP